MADPSAAPDVDPDLMGQLNAMPVNSAPAPAPGDSDVDPALLSELNGIQPGNDNAPPPAAPAQPAPMRHAPTRFQQSVAKPPPSAPPEPELTWGQTATAAAKNFLPSLGGIAGSMWNAVTNPGKTVQSVADLGTGLLSQAGGALGLPQDPKAKQKAEALAIALENHYLTAYGSVKGFKKALATDPASVALDASTVLGGLGAGADAANLTRTAGVIGSAASAIDPVANAVRVASLPVKALVQNPLMRGIQGVATGAPPSLLKVAAEAGNTADPALRAAFFSHFTGEAPANEFLTRAQNAMGAIKQDASDAYMAGKAGLSNEAVPLNSTYDALDKAGAELGMGAAGGWPVANEAMTAARGLVDNFANKSDPALQNVANADALKQQIYDLHTQFGNPKASQFIDQVYHGVGADIRNVDPEYASLMEAYQAGRSNINDVQKTLGLGGRNPTATAALSKSLRAMRSGSGQQLMTQLATKDPTIPYMMAGAALSPWFAGGSRAVLEAPIAWGLAAAHQPFLIPGQLALQSPRIAGLMNYGAGAMGRIGTAATTSLPFRGAYYASRAAGEANPIDPTQPQGAINPTLPVGSGKPPIPATPQDVDTATRMVMTEAGGEPDVGKAAALYAFINRAAQSGKSLSDVINTPWASESTTEGRGVDIDPESPQYKYIRDNIVTPALSGQIGDPTGGMTHFINKKLQTSEGRAIPDWAQGAGDMIGRHTFYQAAGGRVPRATGGRTGATHEELVERLMKKAEAAKRKSNEATKPLLKAPDQAIVKALSVAQQAI